jgi:hypothetical protein
MNTKRKSPEEKDKEILRKTKKRDLISFDQRR